MQAPLTGIFYHYMNSLASRSLKRLVLNCRYSKLALNENPPDNLTDLVRRIIRTTLILFLFHLGATSQFKEYRNIGPH